MKRRLAAVGEVTPDQARKMAADILAGKRGAAAVKTITFGEAFELYQSDKRDREKLASMPEDRAIVARHLGSWLDAPLSAITRDKVRALHRKIRDKNGK